MARVPGVTSDDPESVPVRDPGDGGQLYGQDPRSYRAGRPDYPERVYDVLVHRCGLREGSRVVEIGPGTGLATAKMLSFGANVTGVEVNASMAQYLLETLGDKDLDVVVAPFEDAQLANGAFDLAVAANSFHWVELAVAARKLRRLVVPGGWVGIWGMLFDDPTRPDDLGPYLQSLLGVSSTLTAGPGSLLSRLDEAAGLPDLREAGFVVIESELIRSTMTMDAVQVRALYASMTLILCRPPPEQARLLDALEEIVRDQLGGRVDRHFVTRLHTARNP